VAIKNTNNVSLINYFDGVVLKEKIVPLSISSGVVTIDYALGTNISISSPASDFTLNLINAPTDNNEVINISVVVTQGGTGRRPTAFEVGGVSQTLRWIVNITPTPTNNKIDIFSFTLIRQSGAWVVLGQASLNF
jgi:hypothetical protein